MTARFTVSSRGIQALNRSTAGPGGIAAAVNNAAGDGIERVLHVRPLTDRVIVSTTTGRILALNLENGRVIWQTRLASGRQIQQTLATDDFTAARLMDGETLRAQHDEWPVHNAYHTVFWRPGETIADVYDVPLPPNTASDGLRVLLIVYRAESGAEVGRIDAGSLN